MALVTATFAVDLLTPLGIAAWMFYLVPLWLTAWSEPRGIPSAMAGICSILLAIGHLYSPPGIPSWIDLFNRALGGCTLWVVAILSDMMSE